MNKTAKATGYCEQTVRRVVAEKRASDGATFVSPAKWYMRDRKRIVRKRIVGKRIVVDDFDLEGIRRAVHEFYSDKKYPTLESLLRKSFGSSVLSTSKWMTRGPSMSSLVYLYNGISTYDE